MKILRKYCGFKELDGGVLRLDYRLASELLCNKFFMLLCWKGLHLQKASSPGEFFFPSSPEDFLHHIPTQNSQAAIPCTLSSQKGDREFPTNTHTPQHSHRTLLVSPCSQQPCLLLTLAFGFVCLGHLQNNNNKKPQTLRWCENNQKSVCGNLLLCKNLGWKSWPSILYKMMVISFYLSFSNTW